MLCPHCGSLSDEDDHRCRRCGRLLPAIAIAAPKGFAVARSTAPKPVPQYDSRVAPPMRRVTAAVIDSAVVLLGFGTFFGTACLLGSAFGGGMLVWLTFAISLALLAMFYGLIWAVAMRETPGMRCVRLQLVTFDGTPVSGRIRAIRFVSAWLGYATGGLGLLWALADSESLAFHDLASKTYPAEKFSSRR